MPMLTTPVVFLAIWFVRVTLRPHSAARERKNGQSSYPLATRWFASVPECGDLGLTLFEYYWRGP
jgi:hypothetical protein